MQTPRGPMSVTMTNCGDWGWTSDANGYRYSATDPLTQTPWPPIPDVLLHYAREWADQGGFPGFVSNACLINRYLPGTQMGLHQDKDERDFSHPIVSVSLGLPASFIIGGASRDAPKQELQLEDGDVVVFGGPARKMYHGVKRIAPGPQAQRFNITFRRYSP
jgi:alkylated DNA repair protein (DNA oxidative demethylase)